MAIPAVLITGLLGNIGGIGKLFKDVRAAITGKEILDPTKLAEFENKLLEIESNLMNAQTEINKIEATHPSIFIAGWRPFIGWVSGIGLFYHFIGYSLFQWLIILLKLNITPPVIDTQGLISLVFALLGLGTMRTYEKVKGAEGNR